MILSVIFIFLYGVALDFTAEEMLRMKAMQRNLVLQQIIGNQILGAGLYFSSLLLALLALLASAGSVASEVESGLLHAIVSKPIPRRDIILGKFLGYGSLLSAYALVIYASVLGLNYSDALFRKMLTIVTGSDANPLSSLSFGPFGVSVHPSNAMLAYTCFYIVMCVGFAVYHFERKDL